MTTSVGNVAIWVGSLAESVPFYTRVLGLTVLTTIETEEVREVIVGSEQLGSRLMLAERIHQSQAVTPAGIWKVYVDTEDLAGILRRAAEAGTKLVDGPVYVERFGLTLAFLTDPDGYLIEIGQRA